MHHPLPRHSCGVAEVPTRVAVLISRDACRVAIAVAETAEAGTYSRVPGRKNRFSELKEASRRFLRDVQIRSRCPSLFSLCFLVRVEVIIFFL